MSETSPNHIQPSSTASLLPSPSDQSANLLNTPQLPNDGSSARSQLPSDMDESTPYHPRCKSKEALPTFSRVIKLGMGSVSSDSVSRARAERAIHSAPGNMESTYMVNPTELIPSDFDLSTMSIFRKIWGDPIPFHLIRVKTKKDWTQVKGQVDYMDMGNA